MNKIIDTAQSVKDGDKVRLVTERLVKMKKGYPFGSIIKRVQTVFVYNTDGYFEKILERYGTHQESTRESYYKHIKGMLYAKVSDDKIMYINYTADKRRVETLTQYFRDGIEIDPFTIQDSTTSFLYESEWPNRTAATLQRTSSGLAPKDGGDIHYTANKLENVKELEIIR
jgi:hypothetical protein